MFNIVSSLRSSREDHGVAELLEAVSKRSSLATEEREEIGNIARRVRLNKPKSPGQRLTSPDNSQHDKQDFGKDLMKVDLVRGFGPSQPPIETDPSSPTSSTHSNDNAGMLRDFGSPPTDHLDGRSDSDEGTENFEENRKL
jgi:hypothetical protein